MFTVDDNGQKSLYGCENVSCECIPGRMLCGKDGGVGKALPFLPDIFEILILIVRHFRIFQTND
jgi:hypothetical protein